MTGLSICAACLRRAAQATASSHNQIASRSVVLSRLDRSRFQPARRYAAVAATVDAPRSVDGKLPELEPSVAKKNERQRMELTVQKELKYLEDPWHIANTVQKKLELGRFQEALMLTEKASKDKQVVVSWNHLIDYRMKEKKVTEAIKVYNAMKKRAQHPNAHTYTIIFRGCAASPHPKQAVEVATKHYNILLKDKRLQPNITHLNAVLNVCAKANDLDSLFLMLGSLDETTRTATPNTYSTILHALRAQAIRERNDRELSIEQREQNVENTIRRAQMLWAEAMNRWKKLRMSLDEELVCAMGRMFLLSKKVEVKSSVFELIEQTMGIPVNPKAKDAKAASVNANLENAAPTPKEESTALSSAPILNTTFVEPGCNTMAMILDTVTSTRKTGTGKYYWRLIRQRGLVPDADVWLRYFTMLKLAKASAEAVSSLDQVPKDVAQPQLYRLAMETCLRDNISPYAMKNANRVFAASLSANPEPDLQLLRTYLRTSLVSHAHFRDLAKKGEIVNAKRWYGLQIAEALSVLWEPYHKLYAKHFSGEDDVPFDDENGGARYNDQREVISLARLMYSASQKVIDEKMFPENEMVRLRDQAGKINKTITAFFQKREQREPNLPSARRKRAAAAQPDQAESTAPSPEKPKISAGEDGLDASSEQEESLWGNSAGPFGSFIWDTDQGAKMEARKRKDEQRLARKRDNARDARKHARDPLGRELLSQRRGK